MMNTAEIKKVHVVFKTHLDVGFTDTAENVLNSYKAHFIPDAVHLAEKLNQNGKKLFIWSAGAYLFDWYLKNADEGQQKEMCDAIAKGNIAWHGLALTTHTELMDQALLDFDLSYADRLDARFGKETFAAKMTDVPGHTRAMLGSLVRHGKHYLHLGVNASSMVPHVPESFLWKNGDAEVVVQYSGVYGDPCYVDGMDQVLEFVFMSDNTGIPTEEKVLSEIERLEKKYPFAEVTASTLDDYAREVWKYKDSLPVITEEIGDTWIHGTATDPLKVSRLRTLLRLKDQWIREGLLEKGSPQYEAFMENLLLVCEHTWGMDYKTHLFDFKNWRKEDFIKARNLDRVTEDMFTEHYTAVMNMVKSQTGRDPLETSYRLYEKSWQEQRDYIEKAVEALPENLQTEARTGFRHAEKMMKRQLKEEKKAKIYDILTFGKWKAAVDGTGALVYLSYDKKCWIDGGFFGRLSYETYSVSEVNGEYYEYNRSFKENRVWSEADFGKPGIESVEELTHKNYTFSVRSLRRTDKVLEIELAGNQKAVNGYGCPKKACIRYTFDLNTVSCELFWRRKDANKMPEALWFDYNLDTENPARWMMCKMGEQISPLDVVRGGNRRMHCVECMHYHGADGKIDIINQDSPLISIGGRRLFGGCLDLPDMTKGFSYCLFNNKWGTNFPMWYEEDAYFVYKMIFN